MKSIKRLPALLLCLTVCAAVLPAPCAAEGQGVCYRVTGGKNELFLLGTIHIGSESMYPVGAEILSALQNADTLVLECDTESPSAVAQMSAMMRYSGGETLESHISQATYALLREACDQKGYSLSMLNALRPWAVVSVLSLDSTAAEMGVADVSHAVSLGVEKQLCALADDKPRAYLETAVDQLSVLDGFSPELQEYLLEGVLNTILHPGQSAQPGDADIALWPEWWAGGDANSFASSYLNSLQNDPKPDLAQEYHAALVTRRNQIMAQSLQKLLESDEAHSYFAMIGLMHLTLPGDSVVSLLRDMGYTVVGGFAPDTPDKG